MTMGEELDLPKLVRRLTDGKNRMDFHRDNTPLAGTEGERIHPSESAGKGTCRWDLGCRSGQPKIGEIGTTRARPRCRSRTLNPEQSWTGEMDWIDRPGALVGRLNHQ